MRKFIIASILATCVAVLPLASQAQDSGKDILEKLVQKSKSAAAQANEIEPAAAATSTFNFGDSSITAKPGECYGQVTTPAVTRMEEKKIEVTPASKTIAKIIPAKYKNVTEEIVVQPETEELVTIPATYKEVTEEIVVQPESVRMVKIPAKYDTVEEKVLVKPAHTVWKKGESSSITKVNEKGEVMCLVEVPAEYNTIEKRVLVEPESTKEEIVPAVTKTITKKVIDEPARVEKKIVPEVKKTVTKRVMETPEEIVYEDNEAVFKTVSQEVIEAPEKTEWKKILCQTNATPENVKALQKALLEAGFKPGGADGVLGYQTYQAVDAFQRSKGLSRGEITYDTLQALGLDL